MPSNNPQMIRVDITYFRTTGKYYSEGSVDVPGPLHHDVVEQIRGMFDRHERPGLVPDSLGYIALCQPIDGVPFLVLPDELANFVALDM